VYHALPTLIYRIIIIIRYQDATGFFGMLEAENNRLTFQSLLGVAENWLRNQGMQRISGPFNLSINQEIDIDEQAK
jgi:hypothetical protein